MTPKNLILWAAHETSVLIGEFSGLLVLAAKKCPEAADRLAGLLQVGKELFRINVDASAAGTDEVIVRVDPSNGLLRAVAALRAGDFDLDALEHLIFSNGGPG